MNNKMNTYVVTWRIDVEAPDAKSAASKALHIQRDADSIATVFEVKDSKGYVRTVDLLPSELSG